MTSSDAYDEFVKRLETEFPDMFAHAYGGVAVGEGWWPIIYSLCKNIQTHVDWMNRQKNEFNRGEGCVQVTIDQIKEKFGGLRFYYSGGDSMVDGMVTIAESWAAHTCEECGARGHIRSGGWIRTLCDKHEAERKAKLVS